MMTVINESIQTLVHYSDGGFKPFRFLWRGQSFSIEYITARYKTKDGGVLYYYFAVQSKGNVYELSFNTTTNTWKLTKIQNF